MVIFLKKYAINYDPPQNIIPYLKLILQLIRTLEIPKKSIQITSVNSNRSIHITNLIKKKSEDQVSNICFPTVYLYTNL